MAEVLTTRLYPALLAAALAAWLLLLPFALGRLRRRLSSARPRTGSLLLALILGGLALRLTAVTPARLVYDDEFEQLDAARHLAASGAYGLTLAGGLPGLDVLETRVPWPAGHPVALAAVLRTFGGGTRAAELMSACLSALIALWVFWAALELFGDERGALAAAFLWAVSPLALRYSGAVDSTTPSLFWFAAALAALAAREAEPGPLLDAFAALTLAYAVQVRFENAALVAYAFLFCTRRARLLPAAAALAFPAMLVWANHAGGVPGYSTATFDPAANFLRQAPDDLAYFALPWTLGLIVLPCALLSLGRAPARRLAALAAALFVVYACYYHGRFADDTDDRYFLAVLVPLSVAAAPALATTAVPAVILASGLALQPAPGPEASHEAARRFLADSAPLIPDGAYVVTFNPAFVREVAARPVVSARLLIEDASLLGPSPNLVLDKDWTWRANAAIAGNLERTLEARCGERALAGNGTDALVLLECRR